MQTLVDCGCRAEPHGDGSGIEIRWCDLHAAAEETDRLLARAIVLLRRMSPARTTAANETEAIIAEAQRLKESPQGWRV